MGLNLLLTIRVHADGQGTARFHGMSEGAPEWPPSPARVFQALVAGNASGDALPRSLVEALEWLESLQPPIIGAPVRRLSRAVNLFVPNNDADSLSDPRDVSDIRTKKLVQPSLFTGDIPFLYGWAFDDGDEHARTVVSAANKLSQLGRGVDMAWAVAAVLDDTALQERLQAYPGMVHRPIVGVRGGRMLGCPVPNSLASLQARHSAVKVRVDRSSGKPARVLFTNLPKPFFGSASYEHVRSHVVFELRDRVEDKPWPWALGRAVALVERLRDTAVARLRQGLPGHDDDIERTLVGRRADGSNDAPIGQRVRIVPLPSIGSEHADHAIRRFLLEVPTGAALNAGDVEWAFSGLEWEATDSGGESPLVVTRSSGDTMLNHYVGPGRRFRSVTAVALPDTAQRRRIDPMRRKQEAKPPAERVDEETRAVTAVHVALRHAGVTGIATAVRVQREPFDGRGARAEHFADGTRFAKERLWHVEVEFDRPIDGPLVIGDGRFLGLGVMKPTREVGGIHCFVVEDGLAPDASPLQVARALRRAVMARAGQRDGGRVSAFFSGHEEDGTPARSERKTHIAYCFDPDEKRLFVLPPHVVEHRSPTREEARELSTIDEVLEGLTELRAGGAGMLRVRHIVVDSASSRLFRVSEIWESVTPYCVNRHHKGRDAHAAIARDIEAECRRRGFPVPGVDVVEVQGVAGVGLTGSVRLKFPRAVSGPVVLGRTRFGGGGLFG